MKRYQRIGAMLLALSLSFSLLCPGAWAAELPEEDIPVSASQSEETTAPTEDTTESTAPTEDATESTAPTEDTTESTAPTEDATESTAPTEDATESTAPTEDATESTAPTEDATESTAPAEPAESEEALPEAVEEVPDEELPDVSAAPEEESLPEESTSPLPESVGTEESELPEAADSESLNTIALADLGPIYSIQSGDIQHVIEGQQIIQDIVDDELTPYSVFSNQNASAIFNSISSQVIAAAKSGKSSVTISLSSFNIPVSQGNAFFQAIVDSRPELFFVTLDDLNSTDIYYNDSTGYLTSCTIPFHTTFEGVSTVTAINQYNATLNTIVSQISSSWTPLQKLLFVHDYLAAHARYSDTNKYDAYNLLVKHDGVCQGYTLAATAVLNKLGIPVSYATSEAMNHIWNLVQIGGKWYHMDITWDDPGDFLGQAYHDFFLFSDSYFVSYGAPDNHHHDWDSLYKCPSTAYDNAAWKNAITPFVRIGSKYYYFNMLSSSSCPLYSCNTDMSGAAATSVKFSGYGTGLSYSDGMLYFNTQDSLYAYKISSNALTKLSTPGTMIYGSLLSNGVLYYQTGSNSNTTRRSYQLPTSLSKATVTLSQSVYLYSGSACTPKVTVKVNGTTLIAGTHYGVMYSNNTAIGTATVTIIGKGSYSGYTTKTFSIFCTTPKITSVTNTAGGVTIKWTKIAAASAYRIYRKTPSSGWTRLVSSTTATSYTNIGAASGGVYCYAVSCLNSSGTVISAYLASSAIRRLSVPVLKAVNNGSAVRITWSKVSGAAGYVIYRKIGNATTWTKLKAVTGNSTFAYNNTGIANGTVCTYSIRAFSGTFCSASSASVQVFRLGITPPSSLSNVASKKMVIKWTRNPAAKGYQVQYSTSKAFTSSVKTATLGSNTTVSYTASSLSKGKTYYVRIRTYRSYGGATHYSGWSPVKSVKISK